MTVRDLLSAGREVLRLLGELASGTVDLLRDSVPSWLGRFWHGDDGARLAPGWPAGAPPSATTRHAPFVAPPPPRVPAPAPVVATMPPEPARPLPAAYGQDRVGLLARDPWWLFAYWEIRPRTRVEALRSLGADAEGAGAVLRVYEDAGGEQERPAFDVELTPGADRWYVEVPRAGAAYAVEVGLRTPRGRFVALARSDVVETPPAEPAREATVEWAPAPPPPEEAPPLAESQPAPTLVTVAIEPAPVATPESAVPAEPVLPPAFVAAGDVAPSIEPPPLRIDTAALLAPDEPRSSEALLAR